ncbi:sodium transporter, partial [Staphylococcus pseudintermedius]
VHWIVWTHLHLKLILIIRWTVIAISVILGAVVAGSGELIIQTGLLIFLVVVIHNAIGYLLGFWFSHLFKLNYTDQKTVSIEV